MPWPLLRFLILLPHLAFSVAVASTISKIIQLEIVPTEIVPYIILSALIGAITWNIITWLSGLPTSSSHALIGGLTGAGISAAGLAAIKWSAVELVATFMVISPLIGLACGFLFMVVVLNLTKKAHKSTADSYFRTAPARLGRHLQFQSRDK